MRGFDDGSTTGRSNKNTNQNKHIKSTRSNTGGGGSDSATAANSVDVETEKARKAETTLVMKAFFQDQDGRARHCEFDDPELPSRRGI